MAPWGNFSIWFLVSPLASILKTSTNNSNRIFILDKWTNSLACAIKWFAIPCICGGSPSSRFKCFAVRTVFLWTGEYSRFILCLWWTVPAAITVCRLKDKVVTEQVCSLNFCPPRHLLRHTKPITRLSRAYKNQTTEMWRGSLYWPEVLTLGYSGVLKRIQLELQVLGYSIYTILTKTYQPIEYGPDILQ